MLLGGISNQYRKLYEVAIDTAIPYILFRPLNEGNLDILISGNIHIWGRNKFLEPQGQHLACFAGGMIAIASQIFDRDELDIAQKLVDGCIWAYDSMVTRIMPEVFQAIPCKIDCKWTEEKWHAGIAKLPNNRDQKPTDVIHEQRLEPGFIDISDRRYILRYALCCLYQ
jgi:mannosyl-oligosaccharide alpha-1,2-mannosidase